MEAVRLWTEDTYHFLQYFDGDEHYEMIPAEEASPRLAEFIKKTPPRTNVNLIRTEEGWSLEYEDPFNAELINTEEGHKLKTEKVTIDLTLQDYLATACALETFFELHETNSGMSLEKIIWSKDFYNHWQCFSGEDDAYPQQCPKCKCMMSCSKNHYNKYKNQGGWARVYCSNEQCGHVEIKQDFLEKITKLNMKKLTKSIKKSMGYFDKIQVPPWDLTYLKEQEAKDRYLELTKGSSIATNLEEACSECGFHGRFVYLVVEAKELNTQISAICCQRCFGDIKTGSYNIVRTEDCYSEPNPEDLFDDDDDLCEDDDDLTCEEFPAEELPQVVG